MAAKDSKNGNFPKSFSKALSPGPVPLVAY
jgi:hypothetical protein